MGGRGSREQSPWENSEGSARGFSPSPACSLLLLAGSLSNDDIFDNAIGEITEVKRCVTVAGWLTGGSALPIVDQFESSH